MSKRRSIAVGEIFQEGGLPAIANLASGTKFPGLVGTALAAYSSEFDTEMLAWLPDDQLPKREVAFAYFTRRLRENGTELRDRLLGQTSDPLTQARILRAVGDPPSTWQKLRELDKSVCDHYWREFTYHGLGPSFDRALEAVRGLIGVGRHAAALDLISIYSAQNNSSQAAEAIAEACEGLLSSESVDPELSCLSNYSFRRLFELLFRYRDEVGRQRVLLLEWQLFPVLGFNANAPTLHTALAEDPSFFAELIGYVCQREHDDEDSPEDEIEEEQRRLISQRAYDVLRTWRRCPGVTSANTVNLTLLRSWVTTAREELRNNDRLDSGDIQIGQVLACAPTDPDGSFPPKAVRVLLEEIRNDRIDEGLIIGILQKRSGYSRGFYEGGAQEWELVRKYREQARAAVRWPRTKKLLSRVADFYEAEARRNDDEAERRRRGIDE